MRSSITILHAADVHVGSGEPAATAFSALMALARSRAFAALVIAGDLFDHARVSQDSVDWVAQELGSLDIQVVILPGNHDLHGPESIYARFDQEHRYSTLHVLSDPNGETFEVKDEDLTFWGRPTLEHSPETRPLVGIPKRPDRGWSVVVAHGTAKSSDVPTVEGSPIYPRDFSVVDWDYVALGHIPRFLRVRESPVPAYYAGSTVRSIDDRPGGAAIVDLSRGQVATVKWISLDNPLWTGAR